MGLTLAVVVQGRGLEDTTVVESLSSPLVHVASSSIGALGWSHFLAIQSMGLALALVYQGWMSLVELPVADLLLGPSVCEACHIFGGAQLGSLQILRWRSRC